MNAPYVAKGSHVRAHWLQATAASLAGMQPKVGARAVEVVGIVRHVRGDHPTTPASVRLYVDADQWDGPTVTPPGCACGPHVEVNPAHVVEAS